MSATEFEKKMNKTLPGYMYSRYAITLAVLVAAVTMAFMGNWLPAIFFAVIWNMYVVGNNSAKTRHEMRVMYLEGTNRVNNNLFAAHGVANNK